MSWTARIFIALILLIIALLLHSGGIAELRILVEGWIK